jgi:predicted Zn-dependent protease
VPPRAIADGRLAAYDAAMRRLPIALLFLSAACFRNPATGQLQLDLLSESQEVEIGKQAALETEQTIGLYRDDKLEAFVGDLGSIGLPTSH